MSPRRSSGLMHRGLASLERRRRRLAGAAQKLRRRIAERDRPVVDDVLADRVRSSLGALEKRLDVPRVNVMVARGCVVLHGVVAHPEDEVALIRRALAVPGVRTVDSRLHVGLGARDGRRARDRDRAAASATRRRLVRAATRSAGVTEEAAPAIVGAVLTALAERIPPREREHLCSHLPEDVRALTRHPRSPDRVRRRIRTVSELVDAVGELAELEGLEPLERTRLVVATRTVVEELRVLVPEEAADVAAVLPAQLRELWLGAEVKV